MEGGAAMTNEERRQAILDRLDDVLASASDNPIYDEKAARAINSYLQSIKLLDEISRKDGE